MTWWVLLCIFGYAVTSAPWPSAHNNCWRRTNQASPNTTLPGSSLCPSDLLPFLWRKDPATKNTGIIVTSDQIMVAAEVAPSYDTSGYNSYFFDPNNLKSPYGPRHIPGLYFVSTNSDGTRLFGKEFTYTSEWELYAFKTFVCYDLAQKTPLWRATAGYDTFYDFVYDQKRELIHLSVPLVRDNYVITVEARNGTQVSKSPKLKTPDDNGRFPPLFLLNPVTGYIIFPTPTNTWYCLCPTNWTYAWTLTSPLLTGVPSSKAVITEDGIFIDGRFGLNLTSGKILWENTAFALPLGLVRTPNSPVELYLGYTHDSINGTNRRLVVLDSHTGNVLTSSDKIPTITLTAITVGSNVIYATDSGVWMADINRGWDLLVNHKHLSSSPDKVLELAIAPDGTLFAITNGFVPGEYFPMYFSVYEPTPDGECEVPVAPNPPPLPPVPTPDPPAPPSDDEPSPLLWLLLLIPPVLLAIGIGVGVWVYKRYFTPLAPVKGGYEVVS